MIQANDYLADAEALQAICDTAKSLDAEMSAREMASIMYSTLKALALAQGMKPDKEVYIRSPGQDTNSPNAYVVSWEAGPYQWAITASNYFPKLVEPYYSFDLCFYPSED